MSFWQRLMRAISPNPEPHLIYGLDQEVLHSLQHLADMERRTAEEIAAELLTQAISRRQLAEAQLHRWKELSPREQEVAALICLDCTNRQIAARLTISPQTVKSHVRSILNKTGLRSKTELRQAWADWDFSAWNGGAP